MLKYEEIEISKLKPYEKNARTHSPEQITKIANSIKEFGFLNPVLIDKDFGIIAGHGRVLGAKELGLEKVPCLFVDHLTEAQKKAYIIADNKLALNAGWDDELLKLELENLKELDFDISLTGFNIDELDDVLGEEKEVEEDDFDAELPEEPKAKLGDIYQLGNHRLMCGDSTKEEDVAKLMNGNKADMVFTDPPYNIEIQGGFKDIIGKQLKKTMEDIAFISDFEPKEFLNVLPNVFEKNKLNAYIFCNKELVLDYLLWAKENKFASNILVWKKPAAFPLADNHRCDIEYLLLFRKNAIWHNSLPNVNYSRCLEYSRVNKEKENANHPTPKPVELISQEIQISSNPNGIVVDFFGGSGSTLIACEQLNRKCYMMEFLPKYVDLIISRWEQFTGKKAEKLN